MINAWIFQRNRAPNVKNGYEMARNSELLVKDKYIICYYYIIIVVTLQRLHFCSPNAFHGA